LAKLYDQEKENSHIPHSTQIKPPKHRCSEDGITHTHLFSLDNPSDASVEDSSHEPPEATNFLEPLTKLIKNFKEVSSANKTPAQF